MSLMGSVLILGFVLTACNNPTDSTAGGEEGQDTHQRLAAPRVSLVGSVVSWGEVPGAGGYSIRIGGTQVTGEALGPGARSFDLGDLSLDVGNHVVTLVAVHPTNSSQNSPPSNAVTFAVVAQVATRLSTPWITLAGSVVSWNAVAGAGGYSVRVDGSQIAGGELEHGARSFDLACLGLEAGDYVVTVIAVHPTNSSQNSLPSNAVMFSITVEEDFTISFADFVDMAPDISIIGPTLRLFSGPSTATITVTNPGQYDPHSIRWFLHGTRITGAMVSGSHGQIFTLGPLIDGSPLGIGTHFLTVEVSVNGMPFSRRIAFTVVR